MTTPKTLTERAYDALTKGPDGRLALGAEARRHLQAELRAAGDGEGLARKVRELLVLGQLLRTKGQQPAAGEAILEVAASVNPALTRLVARQGAERGARLERRLAGFRGESTTRRAPTLGAARTGLRPADLDPRLRLGMQPGLRGRPGLR